MHRKCRRYLRRISSFHHSPYQNPDHRHHIRRKHLRCSHCNRILRARWARSHIQVWDPFHCIFHTRRPLRHIRPSHCHQHRGRICRRHQYRPNSYHHNYPIRLIHFRSNRNLPPESRCHRICRIRPMFLCIHRFHYHHKYHLHPHRFDSFLHKPQ